MKKSITNDLANTANLLSVIGGGMSMPKAKLEKKSTYYELILKVPGVSPQAFSIDIVNNVLLIFQKLENNQNLKMPYLIKQVVLPVEVAIDQIHALHDDTNLVVRMPLNELAGGYYRHVDIDPIY